MGEDGRQYITLRRKQEIRKDKKEATEHIGAQIKEQRRKFTPRRRWD